MKSLILIISVLCSSYSLFSQYDYHKFVNYRSEDIPYIKSPDSKDSTCIDALDIAKSEIKNDKKVFCIPYGMDFLNIRFKNELFNLVADKGYNVVFDTISELSDKSQTLNYYYTSMIKT